MSHCADSTLQLLSLTQSTCLDLPTPRFSPLAAMSTMPCGTLVNHCIACASAATAARGVTLSTHVDEFIAGRPTLVADSVASATLREIVYGVSRCRALLNLTVEGLYSRHASDVSRSDRVLFEIFTWMAVFGLRELGLDEFRRFVLSQEAHRMHTLLSFLFDPATQDEWTAPQWGTIYDAKHVQDNLLGYMREVTPQMNALISELASKLAHASSSSSSSAAEVGMSGVTRVARKESTVPQPFDLTAPKVRMLPAPPIVMSATYKAGAIPDALYATSLKALDESSQLRRRETEQSVSRKYAQVKPPNLSTMARSHLVHVSDEKLRAEREAASAESARLRSFTSRPPPLLRPVSTPKLTTAAILREDMLYKRRLEEQALAAAKFESELRDENDFHEWQLRMEAEDNAAKEREVVQRKIDMQQASQDAILALQVAAKEKHEAVLAAREDMREMNEEKDRQWALEAEQKQRLVARTLADKQLIPLAVAEVSKQKLQLAEEIIQEKAEHARLKREEAARDLTAKRALIRQIQAMEQLAAVRAKRPKEVDPTTTGGLGLLDEMSLVELQTRSRLLAEREALFLAEKRARILADKSKKTEVLSAMQRNIVRMRRDMAGEAQEKKAAKQDKLEQAAAVVAAKSASDGLILAERLAQTAAHRRQEALRLVAELKSKKLVNDFYALSKAQARAAHEADLVAGAARVAMQASQQALEGSKASQVAAYEAERNRLRIAKAAQASKRLLRRQAQDVLQQHRQEGREFEQQDQLIKAIQTREIGAAVSAQILARKARNPYAKQIEEREAKRAAASQRRTASASAAAAAAAAADDDDDVDASGSLAAHDEFEASQRMADRDLQQQVAQLSFHSDGAEDDEEEKQPTAAAAAAPEPAVASSSPPLASTTLKRASMQATKAAKTSSTKKPVALAAHG